MTSASFPRRVDNYIGGEFIPSVSGETFVNINPATGEALCAVARSNAQDVELAVEAARNAQPTWAAIPPVQRGDILHKLTAALQLNTEQVAAFVAAETGKSISGARGECAGAVRQGQFMAGEGQRLYGRTTTSGTPNKQAMTVRQPAGVAGLIVAANTPVANIAWKIFPALICGNSVVLKAAEDAPATAWIIGQLINDSELPDGVVNIVHGYGTEAGAPLSGHSDVDVVSFTGSSAVGREIAIKCASRMAKVSLECGGKNPLVVCEDANLENAVKWGLLSAFSNAGQRCASGSRIIVIDRVYDQFRDLLVEKTADLKLGVTDKDDLGPVINERQLTNMLKAIESAKSKGARVLIGGERLTDPAHERGFYIAPTLIESVDSGASLSKTELFGPIATLYRASTFEDALNLANNSPYGLTACIHTQNFNRAMEFAYKVQAGVAVVNAGTYGSEPHMPFGGIRQSGNGSREPGTEALDIYSSLKNIYFQIDPAAV